MHCSGLFPDNFTFPFVVRSCAVLSALREGKEVHCNVIKNGFHSDGFVQSSLVSMYSQSGEMLSSELVFEEMVVRNVVSWTAMIAGYVQNGFYKEGLGVFWDMVASGTQPNAVTLVSVLPACGELEFFNLGKLIHGYGVKVGLDTDISLVNSLIAFVISACASLGALDTGRWAHELVTSKGLETHVSITNALIDMYAKCGSIDSARSVFKKVPQRSVISWTAMIGACAAHGHGEDALELFSDMIREGVRPNIFTFTAVLTACRHSGLINEGRKHFESMARDYKIVPGVEQCACLVDLLGRAGQLSEAYEFVKRMPVKPDVGVWGALLSACRIHGNLDLAELVAEHLFKLDSQNVTCYVLMLNIYVEASRWDDVAKLRKLMGEKELKKIPGQSLVEIN
ncbi:hypothetical protein IFM89_019835 [Coptis chinensis]|uniref:Pentatricopeptide repeat-containing protein n=1 Tax=Coptis chinensis TaxID=261450 RepID=A0A835M362_9MAGN|nr:hypothetical protein IFM89_019835 [Coptis chinensis]